ncbi:MAG: SUF system NifU family Fe-S cluster assembly protein [Candidatus Handelsmanbacteria bacterium]|nr:SUF system NifU family Fe-S cluster assembly protein [Candidatus Handelsmanbacteria bacterium]
MSELRELYQQVILDHNKNPRHFGKLEGANCCQEGYNPLCGDHLHVYLRVAEDHIEDIRFEGSGCAISKASASLMTTLVKGRSKAEVLALFDRFHGLVTAPADTPVDEARLGKLMVFAGVREFPMRVKCATLAWHAMKAALAGHDQPISTE